MADEEPTLSQLLRPPTKVTLFRSAGGLWRFTNEPGCVAVQGELPAGYHINEGPCGQPMIFASEKDSGMSVDEAVRRCLLKIPLFRTK